MADPPLNAPIEALSEAERALIIEKLKEKGAPRPCETCGNLEWQISEIMASPVAIRREASRTYMDVEGQLHPFAILLCARCGNSKFINLVTLGLAHLFSTGNGPGRIRF